MPLDKQIQIISTDTAGFYSNHEARLHLKNHKLRSERKILKKGGVVKRANGDKRIVIGLDEIENKLAVFGIYSTDIEDIINERFNFDDYTLEDIGEIKHLISDYNLKKKLIEIKNAAISESKEQLLKLLANKVQENVSSNGRHHTRYLRENSVVNSNIISVFDSSFTRMIGAKENELCEDFMVIQVFYFDVLKDILYHGYTYKGEKYIYFTSSAGQIRTKKAVFVKEKIWNEHERTIMCGLTLDEINRKGGNNPNKHLAYMALSNSATDLWPEFDIDKAIVIDDFETNVFGTYDLVDDADYTITRVSDFVPISHTDGAGMILPCAFGKTQKNKMVRLPWIKGLLGVFDFRKLIIDQGASPVIRDIYGKEHNLISEDIQVVFTKSQHKMWKYYNSWNEYKAAYKKYGCTAGYTNEEELNIPNASINYQMLQTLTDITPEEILKIANKSIGCLENMTSSIDNIRAAFGGANYNQDKSSLNKALDLYPDLLNDDWIKRTLRAIRDSLIKDYKAGKLRVRGKYTFLLPDFYAACQYWFLGIEEPEGLLQDGEVFCWLFPESEKLDCLRSPHLYREHPIRRNVAWIGYKERQAKIREWFGTNAVYTSCHDLISKILQFDVDGDKSLVVADKTIIDVAERNMQGIVPLYYNMRKASPVQLNNETIYNGLNAAFVGGNIGIYSNNISKIWNSEVFISGSNEERREALDIIKLLCMENNFVIDYAKTLYKPERPKHIHERILAFTRNKLPHFFVYAKDKLDDQVEKRNGSFVNQLDDIIPVPRFHFKKLGLEKVEHRFLMHDSNCTARVAFTDSGKIISEETDPLILAYHALNKKYFLDLGEVLQVNYCNTELISIYAKNGALAKKQQMIEETKSILSEFGYNQNQIVDILVDYVYGKNRSNAKALLWLCYGDSIYKNMLQYLIPDFKTIQCVDCDALFSVSAKNQYACRCPECAKKQKKAERQLKKMLS